MTSSLSTLDPAALIAGSVRERPIDRKRLSEQISAELEDLIVSGRLKPGDRLPSERELTTLFGVGRTSIREAIYTLQRKGIVSGQIGTRATVIEPSAEAIVAELSGTVRLFLRSEPGTREFQRARRFFEPSLARYAARHAGDSDIARMREVLAEGARAIDDPQRFVQTDVDFHFAIVESTRSTLLVALHRAVVEWLREQRESSIGPAGSALAAQRAHARVLDAIAARDPDAAERAMEAHLDEVEQYYWQARKPDTR
jgi:DNA-binding FadR family transcriptional regulator